MVEMLIFCTIMIYFNDLRFTAVFFQLFILKSKSGTNISTRAYALVLILVPDFDFKVNS